MIQPQIDWVWSKIKKDTVKDYYKNIKVKIKHPKLDNG